MSLCLERPYPSATPSLVHSVLPSSLGVESGFFDILVTCMLHCHACLVFSSSSKVWTTFTLKDPWTLCLLFEVFFTTSPSLGGLYLVFHFLGDVFVISSISCLSTFETSFSSHWASLREATSSLRSAMSPCIVAFLSSKLRSSFQAPWCVWVGLNWWC